MRINLQIYDFSKNSKNWILRNKLRKRERYDSPTRKCESRKTRLVENQKEIETV